MADHVSLLRAFQPNMFECLFDFAPSRENKMKRVNEGGEREREREREREGGGGGGGGGKGSGVVRRLIEGNGGKE